MWLASNITEASQVYLEMPRCQSVLPCRIVDFRISIKSRSQERRRGSGDAVTSVCRAHCRSPPPCRSTPKSVRHQTTAARRTHDPIPQALHNYRSRRATLGVALRTHPSDYTIPAYPGAGRLVGEDPATVMRRARVDGDAKRRPCGQLKPRH